CAHCRDFEAEDPVLEVERDNRIVLDNQDVTGQGAAVGRTEFHNLIRWSGWSGRSLPTPWQHIGRFPKRKPPHLPFCCLYTCEHNFPPQMVMLAFGQGAFAR